MPLELQETPDPEFKVVQEGASETTTVKDQPKQDLPAEPLSKLVPEGLSLEEQVKHLDKRYRDEQRYIQQKAEELKALQSKYANVDIDRYNQLVALQEAIMARPNLIQILERELVGSGDNGQKQPITNLPPKPVDYDPLDRDDPTTPSGRWHEEIERIKQQQFVDTIVGTIDQRFKLLEERERAIREQETKRQQEEIKRQRLGEFLDKQSDFSIEDRIMFSEFVEKGPSALGVPVNLDHLRALYDSLKKSRQSQPVIQPTTLDSKIQNVKNAAVPPSIVQIPAELNEVAAEDDIFFQRLQQRANRKPF